MTFLRFSAIFCSTHRNGFATALVFCSRIPALSKCCRLTFLGSQYFGSCPPSVCINLLHLPFADRVKPRFVVYIILCLRVGIGLGFKHILSPHLFPLFSNLVCQIDFYGWVFLAAFLVVLPHGHDLLMNMDCLAKLKGCTSQVISVWGGSPPSLFFVWFIFYRCILCHFKHNVNTHHEYCYHARGFTNVTFPRHFPC